MNKPQNIGCISSEHHRGRDLWCDALFLLLTLVCGAIAANCVKGSCRVACWEMPMSIRSWLRTMMGTVGAAEPGVTPPPPNVEPERRRPTKHELIAYALDLSGLVNDEPETIAFYQEMFANHPKEFVSYKDLAKKGDLLSQDALRALGVRTNTKLSAQFVATLNNKGRADPLGAATVIGVAISTSICTARDLGKMASAGIDLVQFHGSNMAAGPCAAAAELDGQTIPLADAPILPLATCEHPDQCACLYQARLSR